MLALCMSIGAVDRGNGAVPRGSRPRRESTPLTVAVNMGWHLDYHEAAVMSDSRPNKRSIHLAPTVPIAQTDSDMRGTQH